MHKVSMEEARWGAVFPGMFLLVLMIGASANVSGQKRLTLFGAFTNEHSSETTNGIQMGRIGETDHEFLDTNRLIGGYTLTDCLKSTNETI